MNKHIHEEPAPPEAAEQNPPNCGDCFNSRVSLELDKLTNEKESLVDQLKTLQTSAVLEYSAMSKTLIRHAGGINLFTIWMVDQWADFQRSLTKLYPGEGTEELQALIEGFDHVIYSIRDGHDQIAEYLVEKGDEFAAKNLSDSAQEVIAGYQEVNDWAKAMQQRIRELEFSMPLYGAAIESLIENRGVNINE
ncbi:MAG: hypothetical protein KME41_05720 [Candidatus Thiodiazotropha sp. (ex Lucina pensylvanica)]|nr:hypothetical protein [Candidatus Thiodiazotropha sp. (ex Lucina pensylvanica)]